MTKQGLGATGAVLSGLSVIIGDKNTFGKVDSIKIPDWEFEVVNEESTGIIKSPKTSLSFSDLSPAHIAHIKAGKPFVIRGNIRENGKDIPYTATLSMQLHKLGTELKEGDSVKRSFDGRIDSFKEKINNQETVDWNRSTLKLVLGGDGINLLEQFAKNIGVIE